MKVSLVAVLLIAALLLIVISCPLVVSEALTPIERARNALAASAALASDRPHDEASMLYDPLSPSKGRLKRDHVRGITWSVGPDGIDDHGAIVFDPTNGAQSRGDLVVPLKKGRALLDRNGE